MTCLNTAFNKNIECESAERVGMQQRRILNTKEKIYWGIIEELKQIPLTNLTDRGIIKEAQVSSGTFYKYFKNRTDALRSLENELVLGYVTALSTDLKHWHFEKVLSDEKVVALVQSKLNETFNFWNKYSEDLLVLVSKNSDKYFFDQLINKTEMQIRKLLAKYCKTEPENQITSNKLKLDAFSHQMAVSALTTLIWGYRHVAYMSGNDIKKSVAAMIVNAPFKLIIVKRFTED